MQSRLSSKTCFSTVFCNSGEIAPDLGAEIHIDVHKSAVRADHQRLVADVEFAAAVDILIDHKSLSFRSSAIVNEPASQVSPGIVRGQCPARRFRRRGPNSRDRGRLRQKPAAVDLVGHESDPFLRQSPNPGPLPKTARNASHGGKRAGPPMVLGSAHGILGIGEVGENNRAPRVPDSRYGVETVAAYAAPTGGSRPTLSNLA